MENLNLRPAVQSDSQQIARLFEVLGHGLSASAIESRWNDWIAEQNSAIVAESQTGKLVGLVTLGYSRVIHRDRPIGRITALVVEPEYRSHGVGRELMTAAEQEFITGGCYRLEVISNNRFAEAHRFYEHLGYSNTGIRLHKELK